MICPDLLLERDPGDQALLTVLADTFGIPASAVAMVDGLGLVSDSADPRAALVVQRRPLRGAASLLIRVFADDALVDALDGAADDPPALARRIAAELCSAVLVEDGALNPSGYVRVRPDGGVERITLDDDRLSQAHVVAILSSEQARRDDPSSPGWRPPRRAQTST